MCNIQNFIVYYRELIPYVPVRMNDRAADVAAC